MNKIKIVLLFALLFAMNIYSQKSDFKINTNSGSDNTTLKNDMSFFLIYSAGLETDSSKLTLYLGFKKILGSRILLGLSGGIINNRITALDAVYNLISPYYPKLSPGTYLITREFNTKGMTWIIDGTFDYKLFNNLYAGIGLGFIVNKMNYYLSDISFSKPPGNQPLVIESIGNVIKSTSVVLNFRYHYKFEINYNYKSFIGGFYFDNIYSAGINLGMGF